jgi:DNA-directed RNA polymerase subunit H (RpoH/RPB5)
MSEISSNRILKIYKSRNTILQLLEKQDYNISDYGDFSINEIDAMYTNNQLDMLVKGEESDKKIYIKYYLNSKNIRKENLETLVEDLFQIESVLTKADTLIIIINEEPNDTILERIKYLYDHDGIFIVLHNIERLQFNILDHYLVPHIRILNDTEVEDLKKKYNLKDTIQLPEISRFDPQALAVCLRPGQVCSLDRKSNTALLSRYYRVCV